MFRATNSKVWTQLPDISGGTLEIRAFNTCIESCWNSAIFQGSEHLMTSSPHACVQAIELSLWHLKTPMDACVATTFNYRRFCNRNLYEHGALSKMQIVKLQSRQSQCRIPSKVPRFATHPNDHHKKKPIDSIWLDVTNPHPEYPNKSCSTQSTRCNRSNYGKLGCGIPGSSNMFEIDVCGARYRSTASMYE